MITDKQTEFSRAQAVTVTAQSTNIIDLGADRDIGVGDSSLELEVLVDTLFATGSATTLTITLETDTAVGFGTATDIASSGAIAAAALVAGAELFKIKVPVGVRRYLRLTYTVATGPFTAGKITAGFVLDRQANTPYASGLNTGGF